MTIIHILHLKCNKCKNHYGEGNAPNPNAGMYDKKCSMCSSQDYTLIKDFEYNLEGAEDAIEQSNRLMFENSNS